MFQGPARRFTPVAESKSLTLFNLSAYTTLSARIASTEPSPPHRSRQLRVARREPAMLVIPGLPGRDTCDGLTRRELLRVGGSAMLGISLAGVLRNERAFAGSSGSGGPGFGKAKSVIL